MKRLLWIWLGMVEVYEENVVDLDMWLGLWWWISIRFGWW